MCSVSELKGADTKESDVKGKLQYAAGHNQVCNIIYRFKSAYMSAISGPAGLSLSQFL